MLIETTRYDVQENRRVKRRVNSFCPVNKFKRFYILFYILTWLLFHSSIAIRLYTSDRGIQSVNFICTILYGFKYTPLKRRATLTTSSRFKLKQGERDRKHEIKRNGRRLDFPRTQIAFPRSTGGGQPSHLRFTVSCRKCNVLSPRCTYVGGCRLEETYKQVLQPAFPRNQKQHRASPDVCRLLRAGSIKFTRASCLLVSGDFPFRDNGRNRC